MPTILWASDASRDAEQFLVNTKKEMQVIVSQDSLSDTEKLHKLTQLFERHVDTQWMGQFVLGRYWRQATEEQKRDYIALYQEYLGGNYIPKFRDYVAAKMDIVRVKTPAEQEYEVETLLHVESQPAPLKVAYRLRHAEGRFQIIDITGEGVSLINTQRSDFGSAISRKGLDFFLSRLKAKVEKLRSVDTAAK